jgi:hypothetical protein
VAALVVLLSLASASRNRSRSRGFSLLAFLRTRTISGTVTVSLLDDATSRQSRSSLLGMPCRPPNPKSTQVPAAGSVSVRVETGVAPTAREV